MILGLNIVLSINLNSIQPQRLTIIVFYSEECKLGVATIISIIPLVLLCLVCDCVRHQALCLLLVLLLFFHLRAHNIVSVILVPVTGGIRCCTGLAFFFFFKSGTG